MWVSNKKAIRFSIRDRTKRFNAESAEEAEDTEGEI